MSGHARGGRGRGNRGGSGGRGGGGSNDGRGRGDSSDGHGRGGGRGYAGGSQGRSKGSHDSDIYSIANQEIPPPSTEVTRIENAYQANIASRVFPSIGDLRLNPQPPPRPAFGTKGSDVILWTNYFELLPEPDLVLYQYEVKIKPAAVGKKLKRIFELLIDLPDYADMRDDVVSDFKSTLISRRRLNAAATVITLQYRSEGEDEARAHAATYEISVRANGTHTVLDLVEYLTLSNLNQTCPDKSSVVQSLNILLGHYAKSSPSIANIGSSKSFSLALTSPNSDLGLGLKALRGFFSSVRLATCRILVNINVNHGAFYDSIRLDQMIERYRRVHAYNLIKLASFLKRLRVNLTHLPERRNQSGQIIPSAKSIFGLAATNDGRKMAHPPRVRYFGAGPRDVEIFLIDPAGAPSSSSDPQANENFGSQNKGKGKMGDESSRGSVQDVSEGKGRYISVYDYFESVYNWALKKPQLPVINLGNQNNPCYLPAEACHIIPGQSSNTKLDPTQTQKMIGFAVRKPRDNATSIAEDGRLTLGLLPQVNGTLARFGVSVTANLLTVPGRVLTAPMIRYSQNRPDTIRFGSWNLNNRRLNSTKEMGAWSYVMLSTSVPDEFDTNSLCNTVGKLHEKLREMGIDAPKPFKGRTIVISGAEDPQIEEFLRIAAEKLSVVLIVLETANTSLYNRFKELGDVKLGIHTICVVGSKLRKEDPQLFANVALKFNLKLGGVNHVLENRQLGIIDEDKTMVIGIDVTHPSPGSASNAPSVAGMVASVDRQLAQWPADLRIQEARKEMVTDLGGMLKSRLRLWKTKGNHRAFPDNLLIYRDGVSEGQYQTVLDEELEQLRHACEDLYPATDTKSGLPLITIIIVGKRHHTRFYATAKRDADRSANPMCGTVVDRGVTEARNWDFFLQAHTAIQGTARPAHYYIILDEIFSKLNKFNPAQNAADAVESLTHNMCYLFGRATKAVSICPPAYYADIVCERARCYLSGLFDMATPAQSVSGEENSYPGPRAEDITVHNRLRDTMFYI